jgi:hypothetical protein
MTDTPLRQQGPLRVKGLTITPQEVVGFIDANGVPSLSRHNAALRLMSATLHSYTRSRHARPLNPDDESRRVESAYVLELHDNLSGRIEEVGVVYSSDAGTRQDHARGFVGLIAERRGVEIGTKSASERLAAMTARIEELESSKVAEAADRFRDRMEGVNQ